MRHSAWNRFIGLTLVLLWAVVVASFLGCGAIRGAGKPPLPPITEEQITVTAITFSEEEDYTRVTIEGTGELTYEFLELLEDPLRISVKIANASVDVMTPIAVDDGTVTQIVAIEDGDRGRIDIGLADRVDYNITQEATRLYVDIEKVKETKPLAAEKPAVAKEITTLATLGPAKALMDVSVARGGDITEVTITADGIVGDYNSFTLESPPRLVIDLWKLRSRFSKNTVTAGTSQLKRVRIGRHPKKTRLVFDASGSKLAPYRIDRFQSKLVVAMGDVEALEREVTGVLAGVDFKQIDDRSRMVLSSSKRVDYEIFKVSRRDIVVELKKTTAPEHVKRVLDMRAFDSAVEYIRIYNVRSETSRDVRVVIHLREMVDFEAFQEGKRIFVDFQRPRRVGSAESGQATAEKASEDMQSEIKVAAKQEKNVEVKGQEEQVESRPNPSAGASEENTAKQVASAQEKTDKSSPVQVGEAKKDVLEKATPVTKPPESQAAVKEAPIYEFGLTPGKRYTGRRLSLDFKDADIKNILRLIAEVSNLNVVAGADVKGKVTIRLIDVPWDQALDIILFSNNLGKMRMGNVIRVAPVDVLKKEEEQILTSKRTKEKLQDLVTELIPVNYGTAQELSGQVKNILTDRGTVSIDTRTNTLIVKDIAKNVAEAGELVAALDTKTPQVIIEARIVEASSNFTRELGIKWGGTLGPTQIGGERGTVQVGGSVAGVSPGDTVAGFPVDAATSAITFNLVNLGDIANLDVELSALERAGEGEIISAPRIATLDNKEASIEQGLRIPYLKLTAEGTATTEFIEANVKLTVTPHVTNDGHIKMNIKASKDTPDDSITVQGVPAIDKKEAITEVLVKDGDIVVIAGIYSIEKTDNVERVPLLGQIPILGYFFKKTSKADDRRDLLIFISPKIVKEAA